MTARSGSQSPKYRHYKPKDLAVVRLDGKDHYLGTYDSAESREKYRRLVSEWLVRDPSARLGVAAPDPAGSLTLNDLILAYVKFADGSYRKDGRPSSPVTFASSSGSCVASTGRPRRPPSARSR